MNGHVTHLCVCVAISGHTVASVSSRDDVMALISTILRFCLWVLEWKTLCAAELCLTLSVCIFRGDVSGLVWIEAEKKINCYAHAEKRFTACHHAPLLPWLSSPRVQLSSSARQCRGSPGWGWLRNTPGTSGSSCCPRSLNTLHRWPAEGQREREGDVERQLGCWQLIVLKEIFHLFPWLFI